MNYIPSPGAIARHFHIIRIRDIREHTLEMIKNSLRDNAKIVITEHGISPALLLGSLPVSLSSEKNGQRRLKTENDR